MCFLPRLWDRPIFVVEEVQKLGELQSGLPGFPLSNCFWPYHSTKSRLVAVDSCAKRLTFCGFSGTPLDFPKS